MVGLAGAGGGRDWAGGDRDRARGGRSGDGRMKAWEIARWRWWWHGAAVGNRGGSVAKGGWARQMGVERMIEEQCWPAEGWWWRGQGVVGVCGQGMVVAV